MNLNDNAGPVEVWLSKPNIQVTCRVIFDDETSEDLDVDSLSMRGAQREMTAWFIGQGYEPVGRWSEEDDEGLETIRRFKRTSTEHIRRGRNARNECGGATPAAIPSPLQARGGS